MEISRLGGLDWRSLDRRRLGSIDQAREKEESAGKPGSVVDDHSSRHTIADMLKQPTRIERGPRHADAYLVLLRVEFTMP